ncbi:MAG TPA: N utilization substance protein B, partial [Methylophilaceae bacterium]|nr:N utilization substance protein B [Methylophilaceae bacterium]
MSEAEKKSGGAKPAKAGKSRRASRELVLKGIYRSFLNHSDLRLIRRELADDEDFARADEDYFRQLLEGVSEHIGELDAR